MILLWVALTVASKDAIFTLLTVAEARGRAGMAGALAAAGDLANVICMVVGAGSIIVHGFNAAAFAILGTMMLTSLVGTAFWTRLGNRIKSEVPPGPDYAHTDE